MSLVYKILPCGEWDAALEAGVFLGSAVDVQDGFIHFSTAGQWRETLEKHFTGQGDLLLVAVEAEALGPELKWETSRGGALFPHLYAPFPTALAVSVETIEAAAT